jgi:acyl-CoA synthetase (AMP-forming)/AMP-acid ligase II
LKAATSTPAISPSSTRTAPSRSKTGARTSSSRASQAPSLCTERPLILAYSGGENASSLAIEAALAAHPAIREIAVVARPHEKYGERAHAFVVLHGDHAHLAEGFEPELKQFARGRLPGFARPGALAGRSRSARTIV